MQSGKWRVMATAVLAVWVAGAAGSGGTQEKAAEGPAAKALEVDLGTVYLTRPVGPAMARRVAVQGRLPGPGFVELDPSACTVGPFGDAQACTRRATVRLAVRFVALGASDPAGRGRRAFRIEGEGWPAEGHGYVLVTPGGDGGPFRLVVQEGDDDGRRVITLEPRIREAVAAPAPVPRAKYRAERSSGVVTLHAEGRMPDMGYRVWLEIAPTTAFPPEYRLMCHRSAEAAAQVITPFHATATFTAGEDVRSVVVHDGAGRHEVPIEPVPPAFSSKFAYVGVKKCKICHLRIFKSWEQTKMARAMNALRPGVAVEAKKKHGLDWERDYTGDPSCLPCHTTGYGRPGGYAVPPEDDRGAQRRAESLTGVGCEACHGPGDVYIKTFKEIQKTRRPYSVEELRKVGLVVPADTHCRRCHSSRSPTYDPSVPFDYAKMVGKTAEIHVHEVMKQRRRD